jgi:GT2 family glycosyltransferase
MPHIPACLASLQQQSRPPDEVVVVDNASPDGAGDWVRQHHPEVRLLRMERNLGFAGGTNAGLRAATGELLLTLNQDTVAEARFVEEMVRATTWGPKVGMVAAKMRFLQQPGVLNSTGIQVLGDFYGEDRGGYERDVGQWEQPGEVFGPCGGAALYTRALLDDVGLFDEDYFCYFEDLDLAWRARLAGWVCAYNPQAVVGHKLRGSEGAVRPDATPRHVLAWCERNRIWTVAKNAGLATLLLRAPVLLGREAYVLAEALRMGDGFKLRARAEALAALRQAMAKRRAIQAKRRVPEREVRAWMRRMPLVSKGSAHWPAPPSALRAEEPAAPTGTSGT